MPRHHIPLVRAGATVRSAETALLRGVDGTELADVDQAPPLMATLTVAGLRKLPRLVQAPTAELFATAGKIFAEDDVDGLDPERYCEYQALSAGVPVQVARRSLREIAEACARIGTRVLAERPRGATFVVPPGAIEGVWYRKGDVLGVVAPGNNPGVHVQWILALALGYRLVIKPGTKDPFTPARLVGALLLAGLDPTQLSLLPGGHHTGDAVIEEADLSLVFGNDETAARYASERNVILRGPGRSKLLLNGPIDESSLATICTSVGYDAGMRCTNASAVFTDGDPVEVADAIAERLAQLHAAPPLSPSAQLPVLPVEVARTIRGYLDSHLAGAVDVAADYRDEAIVEFGDGSAALRPAVLRCDRTDHPGAATELPFPCVWVLPWRTEDGLGPLGDTLALTILHEDHRLAEQALHEPRIRTVLMGPLPTFSSSATSPHDGYLGQELMEVRGYGLARRIDSESTENRREESVA
jgi:hypothetical protein